MPTSLPKTYFSIMNPKFKNLLRLLESTDEANVRLGLQLARNYEVEVEAHFGSSRQDLEALFDFLMQYEAWNFKVAFWEVGKLDLADKEIIILPKEISFLKNLTHLELENNQLQTLPTEVGNLKSLVGLGLSGNQIQTLPTEIKNLQNLRVLDLSYNPLKSIPPFFCNLQYVKIFVLGTPLEMVIPEKLIERFQIRYE